jgi:hypothetical protein
MAGGAGAAGLHCFLRVSQVGSRDAAGGRAPQTRKNPKIEGQHARVGLREAEPIRRLAAAALEWTAAPRRRRGQTPITKVDHTKQFLIFPTTTLWEKERRTQAANGD